MAVNSHGLRAAVEILPGIINRDEASYILTSVNKENHRWALVLMLRAIGCTFKEIGNQLQSSEAEAREDFQSARRFVRNLYQYQHISR